MCDYWKGKVMDWHFTESHDVRALYLCWRAVGEDRWDSLWAALHGIRPANWSFTTYGGDYELD